jgi:hypothetical protein
MTCQKISRRYKYFKHLYFLGKWKGYQDDEFTWEPGKSLEYPLDSIGKFNGENPEEPRILTS